MITIYVTLPQNKNGMESQISNIKNQIQGQWPEYEKVVFVPDDIYRAFHSNFSIMEEARQKFYKVSETINQKKQ